MQLIDDFEPVPMLYFYIRCKSNLKKRSWKNANNYYDVVIKTKQARKKLNKTKEEKNLA